MGIDLTIIIYFISYTFYNIFNDSLDFDNTIYIVSLLFMDDFIVKNKKLKESFNFYLIKISIPVLAMQIKTLAVSREKYLKILWNPSFKKKNYIIPKIVP